MPGFQVSTTQLSDGTGMGVKRFAVATAPAQTNIAIGDLVILSGSGVAEDTPLNEGMSFIIRASDVDAGVTGTVVGGDFDVTNLFTTGIPAGTSTLTNLRFVEVAIDPNLYLDADVSGTPLVVTDIGQNIDFVATASDITGILMQSQMTLDGDSVSALDTSPFRIIKLLRDSSNVFGGRARVRMLSSTQADGGTQDTAIEPLKTKDAAREQEKDSIIDKVKKAAKGDKS